MTDKPIKKFAIDAFRATDEEEAHFLAQLELGLKMNTSDSLQSWALITGAVSQSYRNNNADLLKPITQKWYSPDFSPPMPGFFLATLDPCNTSPDVIRFWDGLSWSFPFFLGMDATTKKSLFKTSSLSRPYWRLPEPGEKIKKRPKAIAARR